MSKLKNALYAAIPLAAAGYLWFGHETQRAQAHAEIARTPVLIAPGRVEPLHDPVALAFEATGRIAEFDVDEGVAVKAGQVLAKLDDRLPKARLAAAEAAVAQADARWRMAVRGPRGEDIAAAKAELDAPSAEADHRNPEATPTD